MALRKRFVAVLVAVAVFMTAIVCTTVNFTAGADNEFTPTSGETIVIGQITDTHYYPFSYCSNNAAFRDVMIAGMKLLSESSFIVRQGLNDIAALPVEKLPDVLFVTGDITLNGELQGHVEISNLLRQLQNKIREKKPAFQIFVAPGNHDMYNPKAYRYDNDGAEDSAPNITRKLFTKLYSSLGYPDLSDPEISELYGGLDLTYEHLPYGGSSYLDAFINSTTRAGVEFTYLNEAIKTGGEGIDDYENGEISYIAEIANSKFVITMMDEELSNKERHHHVGGAFFDNDFVFLKQNKEKWANKTLLGICHHNILPHFPLEETLLKDFTIAEWQEVADELADLGMRYVFTGHMHSNDIARRVSFNGNPIIDCENASMTGYRGGTRYVKIERGTLNGTYAENYSSYVDMIEEVEITKCFEELTEIFNYESTAEDNYLNSNHLKQYVGKNGNRYFMTDMSSYSVTKLFRNIVDNTINSYLNVDFIGGLGNMVAGILPDSFSGMSLAMLKANVGILVNNVIYHFENVTLKDYIYQGNVAEFKTNETGAKLCGYLHELVYRAVNMPVNSQGGTFADFALTGYITHMGGEDVFPEELNVGQKEALENLTNGSIVKNLLNILLDENNGLLPLVKALLNDTIDLGRGLDAGAKTALESLVRFVLMGGQKCNLNEFKLQSIVPGVLTLLKAINIHIDIGFDLTEKPLGELVDEVLEEYVTESLYTGLGEIAHNIMFQFYSDETAADAIGPNYETLFNEKGATYIQGQMAEDPTVERGQLPGMLGVNFGADPATTKNFVWFTDRRVTDTVIQFNEGTTFNVATATKVTGEFQAYATTTASIDLGVYSTLMNVATGRHTVSLTGLKADTTYTYRVGSEEKGWWSDIYQFRTAKTGGDFTALLFSDIQGSALITYQKARQVLTNIGGIFENGYDFVINAGDAVDNSRNLLQYRYMKNELMDFWGNTTEVVAFGNHDKYAFEYKESVYLDVTEEDNYFTDAYNYAFIHSNLSVPEQNTAKSGGAYYSFDYSGVHFTVLNTNDIVNNGLSSAQLNWLQADLQGSTKAYKVVVMHKGPFSSGSHVTDADVVGIRKQVTPIFAENGVSLVMQGHDHTYSESYFLDKDGKALSAPEKGKTELSAEKGVLYVTVGTMGDKFYKFVEDENIAIANGKNLHKPELKNPTFGKLSFENGKLYYEGFQYDLANDKVITCYPGEKNLAMIIGLSVGIPCGVLLIAGCVVLVLYLKKKKAK